MHTTGLTATGCGWGPGEGSGRWPRGWASEEATGARRGRVRPGRYSRVGRRLGILKLFRGIDGIRLGRGGVEVGEAMIRGNRRPWERPGGDEGRAVSATYPLTVISAHRGWFDWRLRQLWRCRDLIALLVRRDFVSVYKQTILGPTWHVFQPLLTTLTYTGSSARWPVFRLMERRHSSSTWSVPWRGATSPAA